MPGQNNAFLPMSGSIMLALTTVASAPVSISSGSGIQGARIVNLTTDNAWMWMGLTTATATSNTTGALFQSFPVLGKDRPGGVVTISCPPGAYFSGLTSAATIAATVVITAGMGIG